METSVDFKSVMFSPYLPDDAQANPGVFGAELAFWLSRRLARRGVMTSYPHREDWGWFIDYRTDEGNAYRLCCANVDGADDRWRCHLEPRAKGLFRRGKAPAEAGRPLLQALRDLLAEESGISDVVWE
jgi:hypothetical protein